MKIETIITALLVIGIVWGGVAFFLSRAIKIERTKIDEEE